MPPVRQPFSSKRPAPGQHSAASPSPPTSDASLGLTSGRLRLSRTAAAAAPAVEVRRTVGPRRASMAPDSRRAARSAALIPPSGPTSSRISPVSGNGNSWSFADASASRTIARVAAATRLARVAVVARSVTSGSQARLDCLAASRAVARHLARALSPRSACHFVTERSAAQGITASTPISVISSTASSPRSPLGSACATVSSGCGGGTVCTARMSSVTKFLPTSLTTPSATVPAPSPTSARSPARSRLTAAAWCPSGPVSRITRAVTSPGGTRNSGGPAAGLSDSMRARLALRPVPLVRQEPEPRVPAP